MLKDPNEWRRDSLIAMPHCALVDNTLQTFTNNAQTTILFDAEDSDPWNMHSTSTNTDRIVIPWSGRYFVTGSIRWENNSTGTRYLAIHKNGALINRASARQAAETVNEMSLSAWTFMDSTDYFTLEAFQGSGGDLDTAAGFPTLTCIFLKG